MGSEEELCSGRIGAQCREGAEAGIGVKDSHRLRLGSEHRATVRAEAELVLPRVAIGVLAH